MAYSDSEAYSVTPLRSPSWQIDVADIYRSWKIVDNFRDALQAIESAPAAKHYSVGSTHASGDVNRGLVDALNNLAHDSDAGGRAVPSNRANGAGDIDGNGNVNVADGHSVPDKAGGEVGNGEAGKSPLSHDGACRGQPESATGKDFHEPFASRFGRGSQESQVAVVKIIIWILNLEHGFPNVYGFVGHR